MTDCQGRRALGTRGNPGLWEAARGVLDGRGRLFVSLALGAAIFLTAPRPFSAEPQYREIARWWNPDGEARIIAVGHEPTVDELRGLGHRLRDELLQLDNVVVMVFDDPEAARRARQITADLAAALARLRALDVKQADRGEHKLVIYERHPRIQGVIRY